MRDAATLFASLAAAVAGTICGALGAMFDRAAAALRPPVVIDLVDIERRLEGHVPDEQFVPAAWVPAAWDSEAGPW